MMYKGEKSFYIHAISYLQTVVVSVIFFQINYFDSSYHFISDLIFKVLFFLYLIELSPINLLLSQPYNLKRILIVSRDLVVSQFLNGLSFGASTS